MAGNTNDSTPIAQMRLSGISCANCVAAYLPAPHLAPAYLDTAGDVPYAKVEEALRSRRGDRAHRDRPEELGLSARNVDVPIVGDCKSVLKQLIGDRVAGRSHWAARYRTGRATRADGGHGSPAPGAPLDRNDGSPSRHPLRQTAAFRSGASSSLSSAPLE